MGGEEDGATAVSEKPTNTRLTLAGLGLIGFISDSDGAAFFLLGDRGVLFVKCQRAVLWQAVELLLKLLFELS